MFSFIVGCLCCQLVSSAFVPNASHTDAALTTWMRALTEGDKFSATPATTSTTAQMETKSAASSTSPASHATAGASGMGLNVSKAHCVALCAMFEEVIIAVRFVLT
jgi:hypothetical protein